MIKRTQNSHDLFMTKADSLLKSAKKTSLERLQGYLTLLWIEDLSAPDKRQYCREMTKLKKYEITTPHYLKLYDYYELYKWPIALEKLNKLKKKYNMN